MGAIRLHARLVAAHRCDVDLNALAARVAQSADHAGRGAVDEDELRPRETHARLESMVDGLARATAELEAAHRELQAELPAFAIQLAVGIAQEILRRELDSGNYDVEAIVRGTLAAADTGRSACTVHMNPDDIEAIDTSRFRSNTRFEADPDIARGDLHVSTPQGLLVRDIDATLVRVREELLEANR